MLQRSYQEKRSTFRKQESYSPTVLQYARQVVLMALGFWFDSRAFLYVQKHARLCLMFMFK